MIKLMDMNLAPQRLPEVKSSEYTTGVRSTLFHPEGLFSETLFGPKDSRTRKEQFGYIDLHCKILHPSLMKAVARLNKKIINAIERKCEYNFDENDNLVETVDGGEINGITSVIQNFKRILNARNEDARIRIDIKKMLLAYFDKNMVFIDKCLVIPPGWRDAQFEISDSTGNGLRIPPLNDYYQKVIKLAMQINSLSMEPGTVIYEIHASKMQSYVNELCDYLITKVSKKSGLVRNDILGKRIDYCGRAVIIGGSYDIKPDEIGIPYKMLVKLFEPFLLHDLNNLEDSDKKSLNDMLMAYNNSQLSIVSLRQLLTDIQKGHTIPDDLDKLVRNVLQNVIKDKCVIAKRDPCLHAESVRAYKPVMVEGSAIREAVTSCTGHNADFDGDQMAVYVPLSVESQAEIRDKMLTPFSMDGMKVVTDDLSKDFCIGLYNMTKDNIKFKNIQPKIVKNDKELDGLHPNYPIIINGKVTTVGRYKFNQIVPSKDYMTDKPLNKKVINGLIQKAAQEFWTTKPDVYSNFVNKIIELGSYYYTVMPVTFSLDDLQIPKSILDLKEKLKGANAKDSQLIINKMEKLLANYLEENQLNLGICGKAGGLKNGYSQVRQILVCKGIISGHNDQAETITDSYGAGMTSKDHFNTGYAARNGIADRVLNTADTGYLSRRLAYAIQRVECDPTIADCGTKKTISVKIDQDNAKRFYGRYVYNEDNKLELFDADKWMNKVIRLRSPIYCQTTKLCRHCYGELMLRNRTKNVGILAAQILGERLSQVTMKQFHVGGAMNVNIVDIRHELIRMMDTAQIVMFDKQFKVVDSDKLVSNGASGKIIIKRSYYDDKKDLVITQDNINVSYGYFLIDTGTSVIDCTIDNPMVIPLTNRNIQNNETEVVIDFKPNDILFTCVAQVLQFNKKVKMIENVFNGKTPYKSPDHYLRKIYDIYQDLGCNGDYVHYEVLVSNLLRDARNPSYPARLNRSHYQPIIISINSIPTQESWLQAFCFQNSKEAITTGLLYDRNSEATILERLVTNEI